MLERDHVVRRKGKLGKKARITVRKKVEKVKVEKDRVRALEEEKENAEREKRTRRNREKKVKKKAKEKAQKMELKHSAGEVVDEGGESALVPDVGDTIMSDI